MVISRCSSYLHLLSLHIKALRSSSLMSHRLFFYLPSVRPGASAVYVRRNLLFFQLRSLLIKESLAFSMFTSSPTQNTSQAAWTCNNKVKGRNTTIQPFPFKVRNGQRPLKRYTEWVELFVHSKQTTPLMDTNNLTKLKGSQSLKLTLKTFLAQVLNDSSWPHSSSPSPMRRMRSPPSSSNSVSTAWAKAQKCG